jgi:3-deoxy-D-manno-octulosonic-acid transferase
MRALYAGFSYIAHVALAPLLLGHPKLRNGIKERLSWGEPLALPEGGERVWFHGASAGDLLALRPTIHALQALRPAMIPVLSTITNSGFAMGEREFKGVPLRYAPYDLPGATRRAMAEVKPRLLVLEYTELWPNFIFAAKAAGAKVVLHNGRFSQKNLRNYQLLFRAVGDLMRHFDLFLMRDEEEASRAIHIGADPAKVRVTGNTKFDNLREPAALSPALVALRDKLGWRASDPIWVWGSTHDGEEEKLWPIYRQLRERWPDLKLIVAPRYLERVARVHAITGGALRSQPHAADVLIVDTIGELFDFYALATLVFVGGSFVTRGGQNILEPAAHGKPVTFGPHMENFADSVQVLLGRGGTQVKDVEQLGRVVAEMLERPDEIAKLGELARSSVYAVRGAAERNARALHELLG